jgi:hypothetical protein
VRGVFKVMVGGYGPPAVIEARTTCDAYENQECDRLAILGGTSRRGFSIARPELLVLACAAWMG